MWLQFVSSEILSLVCCFVILQWASAIYRWRRLSDWIFPRFAITSPQEPQTQFETASTQELTFSIAGAGPTRSENGSGLSIAPSLSHIIYAKNRIQQQFQQEQILWEIAQAISQARNLDEILNPAVTKIRTLLESDRVIIYRFDTNYGGSVVVESVQPGWVTMLNEPILDPCLDKYGLIKRYTQGYTYVVDDIYAAKLTPCHQDLLSRYQIRANLVVPILLQDDQLWGLLATQQCADARHWEPWEIKLLQQLATQVGIALHQAALSEQLQALNMKLAQQTQQQTQQLQKYQKVQHKVQELETLHQLKDDFLSTVSHELRSPMSNIYMASQMLEIFLKPLGALDESNSPVGRYFNILQMECRREISLVNNLLDLSRLESGIVPLILTQVHLQAWITHRLKPFENRMNQQQQQLVLDIPATLPPLTTDLACLEKAFTELIHNACKYTPAGERIAIALEAAPDTLRLRVQNSGINIAANELPRMFEKFYRIPSNDPWKQGGTGLGLALVKKQVEQIQGTIAVSREAGWLCFTIELPWSLKQDASSTTITHPCNPAHYELPHETQD